MNDIIKLIEMGQWRDAIAKYKELTISATQFSAFIEDLTPSLRADLALLGFYAREQK